MRIKDEYDEYVYPKQLFFAMSVREKNRTDLVKNVKGVTYNKLKKFELCVPNVLTQKQLELIMEYINFPYKFLYIENQKLRPYFLHRYD